MNKDKDKVYRKEIKVHYKKHNQFVRFNVLEIVQQNKESITILTDGGYRTFNLNDKRLNVFMVNHHLKNPKTRSEILSV